ncbi:uncharacterized protein LOC124933742 [Impatiens glandulifera]|uniref:uncharacterized protein LOC124933742 n=1 Tax=Impatiens glandulifera TaxID=253017 RepID=UPI001FB069F8|nr:uncharacterized protein LOC124933742 [Impatiens glandulifera]
MNNRSVPSSSSSSETLTNRSQLHSNSKLIHVNPPKSRLISPKLSFLLLLLLPICAVILLFIVIIIHQHPQNFIHHFPPSTTNCTTTTTVTAQPPQSSTASRLRRAVTFLPLKDLRYASVAHNGHTWFISSMYDTQEEGEVQYQRFPSEASHGRVLCLRGKDTHDGSWNSYGLAWADSLPENATFMKGKTFVSYNHYNYDNIWHGLSAMVPFVAWHIKTGCSTIPPSRWILYHWGELRSSISPWLRTIMEATFSAPLLIEDFQNWPSTGGNSTSEDLPTACFEEAVVMRHNEGGMSRQRRVEVYDLMRCRARVQCNLTTLQNRPLIGMTMFMRTGPRSFRNESEVIRIFEKECMKVKGCQLRVAYSNNLTFCQQVEVMKWTDILISPHGAQLTNMFLMDRNSSVLEFFPKGWLKLAGVGQYVYHWIASWSGMIHRGAWRDPVGDGSCPYQEDDKRCMSFYKSGKIGYNQTHFSEWARDVLNDVSTRKKEAATTAKGGSANYNKDEECVCGSN